MSKIHVLAIIPGSRGEEDGYAFPRWEDRPPEDAPDDAHSAWEDRNPIWGLPEDLDCNLDTDFMEYFGVNCLGDRFAYLATLLSNPSDVDVVKTRIAGYKEAILIFDEAFGPFPPPEHFNDNDAFVYCGAFESVF